MRYIPEEAYCDKGRYNLHDFYQVADHEDAVIDRCRACKTRVIYNKKGGTIDNNRYGRYHYKDILQPYGEMSKLFYEIYGKEGVKIAKQSIAGKRKLKSMPQGIADITKEEKQSWRKQHYIMN